MFDIVSWTINGDAIGSYTGDGGGLYLEFWNPGNALVSEGTMNADGFVLNTTDGNAWWGGAFELHDLDLSFWDYHEQSSSHYGQLSPVIWMNGSIQEGDHFGFDVNLSNVAVNPVPEPGTLFLLGIGLLAGIVRKRLHR